MVYMCMHVCEVGSGGPRDWSAALITIITYPTYVLRKAYVIKNNNKGNNMVIMILITRF